MSRNVAVKLKETTELIEIHFRDGQAHVVAGEPSAIETIEIDNRRIPVEPAETMGRASPKAPL